MMAAVSVAAARVGESTFGRRCGRVIDLVDCAIPIAIVIALATGVGAIVLGFVD